MSKRLNKIIRLIFYGILWTKIIYMILMCPFPLSMLGKTEIISFVVLLGLTVFNFFSYRFINLINMVFLLVWTFGFLNFIPTIEMSASVQPTQAFDLSINFNPIVLILTICYFAINSINVINEFKSLEDE
jgi:hypothetical protein